MAKTFTVTHPAGTYTHKLHPVSYTLDESGSDAATLTLTVEHDFALLGDESASTNPLQVGAYLVYVRGSQTRFRGKVDKIGRNETNPRYCEVVAYDKSKSLREGGTLASVSGEYRWCVETAIAELTDVALSADVQTDGFGNDCPYPVYPAYSEMTNSPDSTSPWIARSASRNTTLAADIGSAVSTDPIQVTDVNKFTFPGFFQVNTEIIQAEHGYVDSSGDHWLGGSILRGALGSTAATHSSSDAVYQRVPKPITDARDYQLRRDPSNTVIKPSEYRVKHTDGRWDFANDPTSYTTLEGDFAVYDVDAAAAKTVGGIIGTLLEATVANLGPGLAGADYDVSELDSLFVPRVCPSVPMYTWDAIELLLDESWPLQTGDTDRHFRFYSSANDQFIFKSVTQVDASPDHVIRECIERRDTAALTRLYSAALVNYWTDEPSSLLSKDRVFHPAIGDQSDHCGGGGNTNLINAILYQDIERYGATGWQADTSTAGNNLYTERLFDGDPSTGWGIRCEDVMWDAADPWTWIVFAWFPGAAAQVVDYVRMLVDPRSWVAGIYAIEVVGLDAYTVGDPPTLGNVVPLARTLFWTVPNTGVTSMLRPRHMALNTRSSE